MTKISSGSTMGKMYADAVKIEEKYASLVYELRHILKSDMANELKLIQVQLLLVKHEDID